MCMSDVRASMLMKEWSRTRAMIINHDISKEKKNDEISKEKESKRREANINERNMVEYA